MTTLTLTITTANQEQMDANINAFAMATGYKPTVENDEGETVPNPVSAEDYGRDRIRHYIQSNVSRYITNAKLEEARVSAAETIEAAIDGATVV